MTTDVSEGENARRRRFEVLSRGFVAARHRALWDGEASFFAGRGEERLEIKERAFKAYVGAGDNVRAATLAGIRAARAAGRAACGALRPRCWQ